MANLLGDDFGERIQDLVQRSIASSLEPPEPPPAKPKKRPFWSRRGRGA
jgi:hypothetical protein